MHARNALLCVQVARFDLDQRPVPFEILGALWPRCAVLALHSGAHLTDAALVAGVQRLTSLKNITVNMYQAAGEDDEDDDDTAARGVNGGLTDAAIGALAQASTVASRGKGWGGDI